LGGQLWPPQCQALQTAKALDKSATPVTTEAEEKKVKPGGGILRQIKQTTVLKPGGDKT